MGTALATVRKIYIRTISDKNMDGDYHRPYKFDFSFFRVKIAKKHSHYLREFAARQPAPRFTARWHALLIM